MSDPQEPSLPPRLKTALRPFGETAMQRALRQITESPSFRAARMFDDILLSRPLRDAMDSHRKTLADIGRASRELNARFGELGRLADAGFGSKLMTSVLKEAAAASLGDVVEQYQRRLKLIDTSMIGRLHQQALFGSSILKAVGNLRFDTLATAEVPAVLDLDALDELESAPDLQPEIEAELVEAGRKGLDFKRLSPAAQRVALFIVLTVWTLIQNISAGLATGYLQNTQAQLENVQNAVELKKVLRCIDTDARLFLDNCRVVTAPSGLKLRTAASKKSDELALLPLGKVITVLDSSDRAWLKVEVELEGEREALQGWVYRRYTKRLVR